jgi:shikimate kinase
VQTHAGVTVTGGWSDYVNTLVGRVRSFSAKVTITGALKSIFGIVLVGTVEESPN